MKSDLIPLDVPIALEIVKSRRKRDDSRTGFAFCLSDPMMQSLADGLYTAGQSTVRKDAQR